MEITRYRMHGRCAASVLASELQAQEAVGSVGGHLCSQAEAARMGVIHEEAFMSAGLHDMKSGSTLTIAWPAACKPSR